MVSRCIMKQLPKISLLVLGLIITWTATAQVQFSVGAIQTNSVNTVSGVGGTDNSIVNSGYYVGAALEKAIPNRDNLLYNVGIAYSYFGGALGGMTTKYNSVNVPFRIKYRYELSGGSLPVGFFVYAGPLFSIGLSATENHESNPYLSVKNVSLYDKNILNRFDMKIGAGLGLDLAKHFIFKAGYDYGVLDISAVEGSETHISYMHIGLGYQF